MKFVAFLMYAPRTALRWHSAVLVKKNNFVVVVFSFFKVSMRLLSAICLHLEFAVPSNGGAS